MSNPTDGGAGAERVPEGVPREAFWDSGHKFWRVGAVGEGGVLQGPHRLYRPSGPLFAEVCYVDGKAEGKYRRYHPNGELAREGEYRRGAPVGLEVAYSSTANTDQPLQKCCVPPGAVKLVLNHFDDGYFEEDFYDAQGRALLPDGEPQPTRPNTVPADARYKPQDRVWRTEVYVKGKRGGTWRVWSTEGEFLESVQYEDNHVHGVREVWRRGVVQSAWPYTRGVRQGAGWEVVPADTYEDAAIKRQRGEFHQGVPVGTWSYLDADGAVLYQVELGPPLDEVSERDVEAAVSTPGVDDTCRQEDSSVNNDRPFDGKAYSDGAYSGKAYSDRVDINCIHPLLQHLRALVRASADANGTLQTLLSRRPAWVRSSSERWLHALQRERLDQRKYLARLLEGVCRGASTPDVVCVMARLMLASPRAALGLAELGLSLAPNHIELIAVRSMALIELGNLPQAQAATSALQHLDSATHADLAALLRVTFPSFDFWPSTLRLEAEASEELPQVVAQDVTRVREMMAKLGLRLQHVRSAIIERLGDASTPEWLPPDCSDWLSASAPSLQRYEFDVGEDEGGAADHVIVDETLVLEGYSLSDLMNRARIEWTALCWLAFGVGLECVVLPDVSVPNAQFGRALTTAFARLYRVADQLKTRGYRARAHGLADAEWEGVAISNLPERLLVQAQAEFMEMRAALFFLADAGCRSLWQDDLRG